MEERGFDYAQQRDYSVREGSLVPLQWVSRMGTQGVHMHTHTCPRSHACSKGFWFNGVRVGTTSKAGEPGGFYNCQKGLAQGKGWGSDMQSGLLKIGLDVGRLLWEGGDGVRYYTTLSHHQKWGEANLHTLESWGAERDPPGLPAVSELGGAHG